MKFKNNLDQGRKTNGLTEKEVRGPQVVESGCHRNF
jgi:hypothetical protein